MIRRILAPLVLLTEPRPSDVLLWCLCGYLVILLVAVLVSLR